MKQNRHISAHGNSLSFKIWWFLILKRNICLSIQLNDRFDVVLNTIITFVQMDRKSCVLYNFITYKERSHFPSLSFVRLNIELNDGFNLDLNAIITYMDVG